MVREKQLLLALMDGEGFMLLEYLDVLVADEVFWHFSSTPEHFLLARNAVEKLCKLQVFRYCDETSRRTSLVLSYKNPSIKVDFLLLLLRNKV